MTEVELEPADNLLVCRQRRARAGRPVTTSAGDTHRTLIRLGDRPSNYSKLKAPLIRLRSIADTLHTLIVVDARSETIVLGHDSTLESDVVR